jgi:hypothetical protein
MLITSLNLNPIHPKFVNPFQEEFVLLTKLMENRLGRDLNKRRHNRILLMIVRVKATPKSSKFDYFSFLEKTQNYPDWIEIKKILTIQ